MNRNLLIKTNDLTKKFKETAVVNKVNLEVPEKCVYGFLGPNGAGKTTTIRMLLSLISPTSGSVELFGKNLQENRKEILSQTGSLVESPSLYGDLNGRDNLRVYTKLLDINERRIDEVLELVELSLAAKKKVKTYSLGMKQRLGIALALLSEPKLLILDEPTNGLDPAGIIEIRNFIKDLPEKTGVTVFVSTHLLSEAELMADYVGIISKGELVFQGEMKELQRKKKSSFQVKVDKPEAAIAVLKEFGIERNKDTLFTKNFDDELISKVNKTLVQNNINVYDLHVYTESLEEIFMNLTK